MKPISILLLILCLSLRLAHGVPEHLENIAEISISFRNYDAKIHKGFLEIIIPDLLSPQKEQLKLSDDGTLQYALIIDQDKQISISYENRSIPLIVSTDDELRLELDLEEVKDFEALTEVQVAGHYAQTNLLILTHIRKISDWMLAAERSPQYQGLMDKTMTKEEYHDLKIADLEQQLDFLETFLKEENISDPIFADWARAKIKYIIGRDLSLFPFMGKINREIDEKDDFFDFLEKIDPNSKEVFLFDSKIEYLKGLSTSYVIISNISNSHIETKKNRAEASLPLMYELILQQLPEGKGRELMLAFVYRMERNEAKYVQYLEEHVSKDLLEKVDRFKQKKEKLELSIPELIEAYDISREEKEELLALYKIAEGKIVFHDFWFASCAPCMKEMPHYNELISSAGEDVVFIMFGVYMSEKEWRAIRNKYQLKGEHHLLSKNQLAFFELYFNVKGYPHHKLLDREGKLIDTPIPRVHPNNISRLLKTLDTYKGNREE